MVTSWGKGGDFMKRIAAILACVAMVLLALVGCDGTVTTEDGTKVSQLSDGTLVFEIEEKTIFDIPGVPYRMKFDKKEIEWKSVEFYEDKIDDVFYVYAVFTFDLQDLSEDEIRLMEEERRVREYIFMTSEENDSGMNIPMERVASVAQGNERKIVYASKEGGEYSFRNAECTLNVMVDQTKKVKLVSEETGEITIQNEEYKYMLSPESVGSEVEDLPTTDEMDREVYEALQG
jgi:hypothetical protein